MTELDSIIDRIADALAARVAERVRLQLEAAGTAATFAAVPESRPAKLPPYLTPAEVAERLQVSIEWLSRMRAQRRGPAFVKYGRRIRYASKDLVVWEKTRAAGGGK